jgi:hypothetical protein
VSLLANAKTSIQLGFADCKARDKRRVISSVIPLIPGLPSGQTGISPQAE